MFKRRLNEPFGKAGVAIGVVALVFAMLGGAYAATGGSGKQLANASKGKKKSNAGLNGKQKKEVKKISKTEAKKFAEKGDKGDKGDNGAAGAAGKAGESGKPGEPGKAGADGETPAMIPFGASKGACTVGGVEFKTTAQSGLACNGKPGDPWTAGGTLPAGRSLVGAWGMSVNAKEPKPETEPGVVVATQAFEPISFFLPLTFIPEGVVVGTTAGEKAEGVTKGCPGIVEGVPTATAGKLCVYMTFKIGLLPADVTFQDADSVNPTTVGKTGTILKGNCLNLICQTRGSWAVTAP